MTTTNYQPSVRGHTTTVSLCMLSLEQGVVAMSDDPFSPARALHLASTADPGAAHSIVTALRRPLGAWFGQQHKRTSSLNVKSAMSKLVLVIWLSPLCSKGRKPRSVRTLSKVRSDQARPRSTHTIVATS
jgi:hypothetical protein